MLLVKKRAVWLELSQNLKKKKKTAVIGKLGTAEGKPRLKNRRNWTGN